VGAVHSSCVWVNNTTTLSETYSNSSFHQPSFKPSLWNFCMEDSELERWLKRGPLQVHRLRSKMGLHTVTDNRVINYGGLTLILFHSFYITHTLTKYFFLGR